MKTSAITILFFLATATPCRADNSFSLRISNSFVGSPGFDTVSENDMLAQAEFNYARRVLSLPHGHLWAEASYMAGTSHATLFGEQFKAQAFLQSVTVGARYTYPILSWVVPFTRAGLGVGVGTYELSPQQQKTTIRDRAASFSGYLLAGVEVLVPHRRFRLGLSHFTGGLVIEAGYGLSSDLSFDLAPEPEDEDLRQIPLRGSTLGTLSLSGAQIRVGALIRF
jgi:hypothetical protein